MGSSFWGVHLWAQCGELSWPSSSSEVHSRDSDRAEIGIKQEPKLGELNLGADFRGIQYGGHQSGHSVIKTTNIY